MKKLVIAIVLACVAVLTFAQQAIDMSSLDLSKLDPSKFDMSNAQVSVAGPQSVYIQDLMYNGVAYSALLTYDGAYGATIKLYDYANTFLAGTDLSNVKLQIQANGKLLVSDILIGGSGYGGRLSLDLSGSQPKFVVASGNDYWKQATAPTTSAEKVADLNNQIDALNRKVGAQSKTTTAQAAQVTDLQNQLDQAKKDLASVSAGSKSLEDVQKAQYERQIADLQTQLKQATADLAAAKSATTTTMMTLPTAAVVSGISGGNSLRGTWNVNGGTATQSDASQYFAKYSMPVSQTQNQILYSFTARSTGSGFVGLGLHFAASGSTSGKGYGLGKSYLVWLTRDPGAYGSNATFVQLYASNSDTEMTQLASTAVAVPISSSNAVQVLYDKSTKMITVWVNNSKVLDYTLASPLASGTSVAFRTLGGGASFSNFSVKAK
jgi:uncharacterized coiled-coil protein SlyX